MSPTPKHRVGVMSGGYTQGLSSSVPTPLPKRGNSFFCFSPKLYRRTPVGGKESILVISQETSLPNTPSLYPPYFAPTRLMVPTPRALPVLPFPPPRLHGHINGLQVTPLPEEKVSKQVSVGQIGSQAWWHTPVIPAV